MDDTGAESSRVQRLWFDQSAYPVLKSIELDPAITETDSQDWMRHKNSSQGQDGVTPIHLKKRRICVQIPQLIAHGWCEDVLNKHLTIRGRRQSGDASHSAKHALRWLGNGLLILFPNHVHRQAYTEAENTKHTPSISPSAASVINHNQQTFQWEKRVLVLDAQ